MHRLHARPGPRPVVPLVLAAVASVFTIALLACLQPVSGAAPPGHLDILSAQIVELPPIDATSVQSRGVVLRLVLDEPPPCGPGPHLLYGFLVDSDRDPTTGSSLPAFAPLGVDARLTAVCDPLAGGFVSDLGPVTLTVEPHTMDTTLEIQTSVGRLPSVELDWFAVAQEDARLYRVPDVPVSARWAIHERQTW